jgi:hypothetical protein
MLLFENTGVGDYVPPLTLTNTLHLKGTQVACENIPLYHIEFY